MTFKWSMYTHGEYSKYLEQEISYCTVVFFRFRAKIVKISFKWKQFFIQLRRELVSVVSGQKTMLSHVLTICSGTCPLQSPPLVVTFLFKIRKLMAGLRASLHQASVSVQSQCYDDAGDSDLIKDNPILELLHLFLLSLIRSLSLVLTRRWRWHWCLV